MTHLACFDLTLLREEDYAHLYEAASPERRARAEGFRRREDALRCLAAEALLRWVAKPSGIPMPLPLVQAPGEKPYLSGWPDFHFNLSHCGRWVVLAWGDSPVGVDVEEICENKAADMVARRHFTQDEQDFLLQTEEAREGRFFRIWTAKESYVKYLGTGLTIPLRSFSVLSMESPRFYHRELPGGYALTLCAREDATPEFPTRQQLVP